MLNSSNVTKTITKIKEREQIVIEMKMLLEKTTDTLSIMKYSSIIIKEELNLIELRVSSEISKNVKCLNTDICDLISKYT